MPTTAHQFLGAALGITALLALAACGSTDSSDRSANDDTAATTVYSCTDKQTTGSDKVTECQGTLQAGDTFFYQWEVPEDAWVLQEPDYTAGSDCATYQGSYDSDAGRMIAQFSATQDCDLDVTLTLIPS